MTICFENDVLVVSDEIHSDLIFHGKKHTPAALAAPGADKKVITCISVTKTFNLAGLQASTTVFPCLEMKKKFDSLLGRHGHPPEQRLQLRGHGSGLQ